MTNAKILKECMKLQCRLEIPKGLVGGRGIKPENLLFLGKGGGEGPGVTDIIFEC